MFVHRSCHLSLEFLFIDLAITSVVKSIPTIPTGWRVGLSIHPYQVSCRFWILAVPRPPRMAERAGDGAWFPLAQEILWDVRECSERCDVTMIWGFPKMVYPPNHPF